MTSRPTGGERREIKALTALRGVAAMAVVLQHYSATAAMHADGWIPSLFPHGYMAVDFFFVLSGFIMSYTYLADFEARGMKAYLPFLWKRVARIFPLSLTVLAIILLCGGIASFWGNSELFISPNTDKYGLGFSVLMNILHLQGFISGVNLNDPSWSISVELAAYLFFPLLIVIMFRAPAFVGALFCLAGASILTLIAASTPNFSPATGFVETDFARCVVEFAFGMGVYGLYRRPNALTRLGEDRWTWAALGVSALSLLLRLDLLAAFSFPFLVLAFALNRGAASRIMSAPVPYFLGTISFSIYLVHQLFRAPELSVLQHLHPPLVSPAGSLLFALAGSLAVLPFATLAYYGVERPGRVALNAMLRRVQQGARSRGWLAAPDPRA